MVNVNILYHETSGKILSASLYAITEVPDGYAVDVKSVDSLADLFDKRIDPDGLPLVGRHFLQLDSDTELDTGTVTTAVFTKHDGATEELKDAVEDADAVKISARQPDFSFSAAKRKAFFDVPQTALLEGAGQVKVASALAPGAELLVVVAEGLRPIFQQMTYV